jgi:hypothetical protein
MLAASALEATMIRKSAALTTLLLLSACMGGTNTPSLTSCLRQIDPNYGKPKVKPKASVDAPVSVSRDATAAPAQPEAAEQIVEDMPPSATPREEPSPDAVEAAAAAPAAKVPPRTGRAAAAPARRYASGPQTPAYTQPEADWRGSGERAARLAAREERLAAREARLARRERRAAQDAYDRRVSRDQRRSCLAASIDAYSTPAEVQRARQRCRDAG